MMTSLLLGLNILFIMGVWRFVVKKTLLDHTQDKLLELRDEVRSKHLENAWDMNSAIYANTLAMIDGQIRYTKHYSAWAIAALHTELADSANAELLKYLTDRINARFKTDIPQQKEYVDSVRDRATDVLTKFVAYNSGLLVLWIVLVAMPAALFTLLKDQVRSIPRGRAAVGVVVKNARSLFNSAWSRSTKETAAHWMDPQILDFVTQSHGPASSG